MEIVLDTNVLVSGMLNPAGKPGELVDLVVSGQIRVAFDDRITDEYNRVLRRPRFGFTEPYVTNVLTAVFTQGRPVIVGRNRHQLPDDHDRCFLECAAACGSGILVAGNKRHFPSDACAGVTVLSPAEFFLQMFSGR